MTGQSLHNKTMGEQLKGAIKKLWMDAWMSRTPYVFWNPIHRAKESQVPGDPEERRPEKWVE